LAAEPRPPLLVVDEDEAGELVVAAEQVDPEAYTLRPVAAAVLVVQQPA